MRIHTQRNHLIAAAIAASILLGMSMGVNAYAIPADTMTGETYRAEAMLVAPDALENDGRVMDAIPATTGGKIGMIGSALQAPALSSLQTCIDAYAQNRRDVSFVMMDLMSGRTLYYNTGLVVYSASCIKGPYIISCLAAGNDATNDMYLAGHFSDNEAYGRIRSRYGSAVFADWLYDAGVDRKIATYHYAHLTAVDLSRMWLAMYPYILGDKSGSRSARQILQGSRSSALDLVLGGTTTVYSKAGWISSNENPDYNVYNVGGIVMDEHPYLVAITSTARGEYAEALELVTALDTVHEAMVADLAAAMPAETTPEGTDAADDATEAAEAAALWNPLTDPVPAGTTNASSDLLSETLANAQ